LHVACQDFCEQSKNKIVPGSAMQVGLAKAFPWNANFKARSNIKRRNIHYASQKPRGNLRALDQSCAAGHGANGKPCLAITTRLRKRSSCGYIATTARHSSDGISQGSCSIYPDPFEWRESCLLGGYGCNTYSAWGASLVELSSPFLHQALLHDVFIQTYQGLARI
jgi:hypothetical protein